jgi:asparagine synthase (glutamine-hydrolysing)
MCGIAALFSPSKPVLRHALNCAVHSLIHRGPDNQSVWLSTDQRVGLGHTRLSIIDLATGDQPIANEHERVRIVVNGEFYDFQRQRRELEQRGHHFRTRSDSEVATGNDRLTGDNGRNRGQKVLRLLPARHALGRHSSAIDWEER